MVGKRDTPKSIQDGPFGLEPDSYSSFDIAEEEDGERVLDPETAKRIGREIYQSSTNWLNSGRRARWNDANRAFQGLHPSGSKYLSREFANRSRLYRPKTRAMVRKAEAQTAAAFFSNEDVVSITPTDPDDQQQVASAEINKALLQYRLTYTIPWFLTLIGARQDAEVLGICVAKAYWLYEEEDRGEAERPKLDPVSGMPMDETETVRIIKPVHDEPHVDLIAPENIRFEPGCDWRHPCKSSPYIIEEKPMYVQEVIERIEKGEWHRVSEGALRAAADMDDTVTRRSREQGRVPGKEADAWKPRDFSIVWVRENIVVWGGKDWHFYSLGEVGELLSDPKPLSEVYLHGERPYVSGFVVLETHKTYPAGKVEIVSDLQRASNDDWNLRFDSVKAALHPRQFVRSGAAEDIGDLRSFFPGKIVLINSKPGEPLTNSVTWDRPPEPGQSAYAEQDRINLDFDELVGDFSNSSVQASQIQQQSATGMHLMSGQASGMNEYELRVFGETFVEPLIKLLLKLEQAYETNPVILATAGKSAQLYQKFGVNHITDELLQQELTVRVNVGIGATNPKLKMANLMQVAQALGGVFGPIAAQGANFGEVAKEMFALAGYKDGERFLKQGFDPHVAQLQQEVQKLQQKGGGAQRPDDGPIKLQIAQMDNQAKLKEMGMDEASEARNRQIQFATDHMKEQNENWRVMFKAQQEAQQGAMQMQHDLHQTAVQGHQQSQLQAQQGQHDMGMQAAKGQHEVHMQAMQPPPQTKAPPAVQSMPQPAQIPQGPGGMPPVQLGQQAGGGTPQQAAPHPPPQGPVVQPSPTPLQAAPQGPQGDPSGVGTLAVAAHAIMQQLQAVAAQLNQSGQMMAQMSQVMQQHPASNPNGLRHAVGDAVDQMLVPLDDEVKRLQQEIADSGKALKDLHSLASSPKKVIRDASGRPVAVEHSGQQRQVQRDGNGKISGLH